MRGSQSSSMISIIPIHFFPLPTTFMNDSFYTFFLLFLFASSSSSIPLTESCNMRSTRAWYRQRFPFHPAVILYFFSCDVGTFFKYKTNKKKQKTKTRRM